MKTADALMVVDYAVLNCGEYCEAAGVVNAQIVMVARPTSTFSARY
jgi:hypothetical protein